MLICRGCKNEFIPKRKGQKFCTRGCFLESTKTIKSCPQCGDTFNSKFSKQICCTSKCANEYRALKITKGKNLFCTFDGKSIYKMQSRIRINNFCNNSCKIAWLRSEKNVDKGKYKHTQEAKEKIRQSNLNRDYNKVFTVETRKKLSESAKNKVWTNEARAKLRQANLGKKHTLEEIQKIKDNAKYGEENYQFKGEKASYEALHLWAKRHLKTPKICVEKAGDMLPKLPCAGRLELSNVDHTYRRDINDFSRRCTRHHRQYDWQNGLYKPKGKASRFVALFGNIKKNLKNKTSK